LLTYELALSPLSIEQVPSAVRFEPEVAGLTQEQAKRRQLIAQAKKASRNIADTRSFW
jgi:hypothetical protein